LATYATRVTTSGRGEDQTGGQPTDPPHNTADMLWLRTDFTKN